MCDSCARHDARSRWRSPGALASLALLALLALLAALAGLGAAGGEGTVGTSRPDCGGASPLVVDYESTMTTLVGSGAAPAALVAETRAFVARVEARGFGSCARVHASTSAAASSLQQTCPTCADLLRPSDPAS